MKIIKFCTVNNNFWNNIKNSELYFNNLKEFNDPFEGIFRFKLWNNSDKIKLFYLEHFHGNPKKIDYMLEHPNELENLINQTFEHRFINNGITCFSDYKNLESILMWSHYSSQHTGVCMSFDTKKLSFLPGNELYETNLKNGKLISAPNGPHKINYTKEYLDSDPLSGNLNQNTFLTTKFDVWKYENEYRYIAPIKGLFSYNPESITEVIFGLRTPNNTKVGVKNIFDELGLDIHYKKIEMEQNKFSFIVSEESF
ncbi:DUF2971 domain-containing protein [Sphingobacterium sp. SG20118]|uniref:DUF2971 domain-containing protein n=1 Tax=Sphingobacterium sp. SG20118 TaxID=3367156 RepID=UPI0037DFBFB7